MIKGEIEMSTQLSQPKNVQATEEPALNKRLDTIGWALLLILTGGVWLSPKGLVPEGTWLIGLGLILLGVNVARSLNAIPINGFTTTLGILALVLGGGELVSSILGLVFDLPVFAISLIAFGAILLARELTGSRNA
jgi:hypothetical protein